MAFQPSAFQDLADGTAAFQSPPLSPVSLAVTLAVPGADPPVLVLAVPGADPPALVLTVR